MSCEAKSGPVFQIEDDEEDDLASPRIIITAITTLDNSTINTTEQTKPLLFDTSHRIIGTAGCCGAFCLLFSCLCFCGACKKEFIETYRRHTLCGRWCPI